MSLVEHRNPRTSFLWVLCLACWLCVNVSLASAQERGRPSAPAGSPTGNSSQRLLPLPPGASTDLQQQVEWLQQLQGLMAVGSLESDTSATPKFDPEQLSALLSAMKQFSEAVPPGTVLPKPDGHSPEQLLKRLSDPAVQEQVRQLLKQFSQNGKLPPRSESGDSKSVPFPSASTPRSAEPAQESPVLPPHSQEWLKRLLQQAGRQPNEPLKDPKSEDQKLKPVNPDRERVEPDAPATAGKPKPANTSPNEVERGFTGPRVPGFRDDEPIQSLERARSELEAIMLDPRNELNLPSRPSETNQKPFGQSTSDKEKVDAGRRPSKPTRAQPEAPVREPATNTTPPSKPAVTSPNPGNTPKSPQMDVRSELQERGFTQTLRRLIDQAREESRAESNGSAATPTEGQGSGNGSLSGLEKSITRLIDGLRKDIARETSQVPTPSPAPMPATTAAPQAAVPPSGPERRSTAGKMFESIGNAFKEMAAAPETQSGNARSRQGRSSSEPTDMPRLTSRSTGPLLMLLVALGLVWYFLPRVVAAVKASPLLRRSSLVGEVTSAADIRTREDVVRAFHQYALQSAMSVPDWWTHREVERQVAHTTPALKPSIQVLADLYELARYLPGEAELTADQIRIARRELENVSRTNHLG